MGAGGKVNIDIDINIGITAGAYFYEQPVFSFRDLKIGSSCDKPVIVDFYDPAAAISQSE
jgi:hypothetical protein